MSSLSFPLQQPTHRAQLKPAHCSYSRNFVVTSGTLSDSYLSLSLSPSQRVYTVPGSSAVFSSAHLVSTAFTATSATCRTSSHGRRSPLTAHRPPHPAHRLWNGSPGHRSLTVSRSIAIVNSDKCKPKKCRQECKKSCPVVRTGKLCIEVDPASKIAFISERLCIGCGICPKKCPFDAINIINLPTNLETQVAHRYSANSFKLHRLPLPRPGQVLGLVGTNGIGKSTALKILAGKLKPNLGRYDDPPDWEEILKHYRGSELQSEPTSSGLGNWRNTH